MKFRSQTMMVLLYPDNEEHVKALDIIKCSFDYACVLHNKDYNEDGEFKKAHYHVVLRFGNLRWNTAIAKSLGIDTKFLQECKNFDNALLYLIHYNDPDKAQYTIDEVQGTLKKRLKENINKVTKSEGEKVAELLAFITERDYPISVTDFAKYCAINGYWAEFRRSGSIFCKVIDEHNFSVIEKKRGNCQN